MPVEKLQRARTIVEQAIKAQQKVRFERCYFKEIGASAFIFDASFFVTDANFNTLAAAQQDINFRIVEAFAKEDIELSAPLQAVHLKRAG